MYLPHICTLEEAANYLSGKTGDSWTPKAVLDFALCNRQPSRKPAPVAFAAMPIETPFGRYEFKSPGGMVRKGSARWQLVPLYPIHAAQLVAGCNTFVGLLQSPDDSDGVHYAFIEPLESEHEITLDMVRLKSAAIESMFKQYSVASSGAPESNEPTAFHPSIGWQVALYDAWSAMKNLHGREPSAAEAIRYLKKYDNSGTILSKGGDNELWWKTNRGKLKEVQFRTVETCISSWRTMGRLPA